MKKILFGMMAAAVLATSCAKELQDVATSDATVTFAVGTPEIATRAYSDGATATVLQYAVYDAAGNELEKLTVRDAKIQGSTTVKLQLTTGNTYSVIFWAAAPKAPYTVDFEHKTMTVDYTAAVSNDEARDAFFKKHTFTVTGAQTETIELRRPFAQLNIGTADYAASTSAGYTPVKSAVTVKSIYNTLNLWDGEVSGEAEVTYDYAAIPSGETFPVTGYEYLAMNYLLVAADKALVDIEFGYTETDADAAKTRTVGSVPVQRNYRTNIYGNLLTSDVDINVEIKPDYDKDDNNVEAPKIVTVTTAAELNAALADPEVGEVVLNGDIETEGFVFAASATRAAVTYAGRDVVIDGNGNTLTYKGTAGGRIIDFTSATNGANLTIKNLTIINNVSWIERAVNYNTNGTLTLEDVTIKSAEGCSLNYAVNLPGSSKGVKVEIKDCEIWAGAQALNVWGEKSVINVTDSDLYVVDDSAAEGRSVVAVNNDGTTTAEYSVLNFNGGSIQVVYKGEGETKPSYAVRDNTTYSQINISDETLVVGEVSTPVALIYWEGQNQFYSLPDLNKALAVAVPEYNATGVRMIKNLELPLAYKAIYGTPVAVQMKNGGVFDGCGNTLSVEKPVYESYVVETYGGTIKNLNITTPAGRGIIISSPKENIYIDNVLVDGPGYAINTTEHNGKELHISNSTVKGWTSLAGVTSVSFTKCTLGANTYKYWQKFGYDQDYDRLLRPYVSTLLDCCNFEQGYYLDLSALGADCNVTFKNCVCGETVITADNYAAYITIELPSGRTLADCVVFE